MARAGAWRGVAGMENANNARSLGVALAGAWALLLRASGGAERPAQHALCPAQNTYCPPRLTCIARLEGVSRLAAVAHARGAKGLMRDDISA